MPRVDDIMATKLTTCDPEATIGEIATLMGERSIGSVLICSVDRLLGIITERDIVRAMTETYDAAARPVSEWMTKGPTSVPPGTDARDALKTMVDGGFRHLPVCDGDRVVGMVSMRDVAGALTE